MQVHQHLTHGPTISAAKIIFVIVAELFFDFGSHVGNCDAPMAETIKAPSGTHCINVDKAGMI